MENKKILSSVLAIFSLGAGVFFFARLGRMNLEGFLILAKGNGSPESHTFEDCSDPGFPHDSVLLQFSGGVKLLLVGKSVIGHKAVLTIGGNEFKISDPDCRQLDRDVDWTGPSETGNGSLRGFFRADCEISGRRLSADLKFERCT